ncbi:hypothetical protein Tco_0017952 [Tanacetum coccineum]
MKKNHGVSSIMSTSTISAREGIELHQVCRSGRLVYQKDSDVVDVMGDSLKTKACGWSEAGRMVYQEDLDDDDFVDESIKQKDFECLVNTKRLWNRSTHYNGPLVMLLILYANSTKSITQNVKRITPAIAFWTASLLNKREMEEISSGGFGIHEQGEKRENVDGEKQEVVVAEIQSTQIAVKLEIDEADGDEGLYPVLEDGMFSKYGTERPPQNLKGSKKICCCFKCENGRLVRSEMCHELESNECTTPKDNMDRSKEAANANGNLEGDMLSFTQMYGTPTELIRLSDQVMRSRKKESAILLIRLHHREGEMKFAEYKILRMGCRTMKNFVDCGVFAMRHMETYKGEGHYGHKCGLRTEGKAQNFLLNDLRYKYVSKMLLCEINMKKEEVEIETEAYKSLSIGEKRRLSADASATLMERMEKMF